jgi:hypothetical protein
MGFITHALKNMLDPAAANSQAATDASNLAYGHQQAAQTAAMAKLSEFLGANPNPASGWGAIKGPSTGQPASVGGPMGGPQTQGPAAGFGALQGALQGSGQGQPGQTPGIAPGPGGPPMGQKPGQGGIPPQLLMLLQHAMQQQKGGVPQGGQQPQMPQAPVPPPNIQLPHPGPIIRMGPQG